MASDEQVRSIMAGVEGANAENERLHLRIKDLERGWENYSADLERLNVQDSRIKDLEEERDRYRSTLESLRDGPVLGKDERWCHECKKVVSIKHGSCYAEWCATCKAEIPVHTIELWEVWMVERALAGKGDDRE